MKRVFTFLVFVMAFGLYANAQRLSVTINSPANLAGEVTTPIGTTAGWDLGVFDVPLTADAVVVDDGSGNPTLGCEASPEGAYDGKIVLIRRGVCAFVDKASNAAAAGAIGVIVINNEEGDAVLQLGGELPTPLDIPVIMFGFNTGEPLIAAIENGETVNITWEYIEVNLDVEITIARNPLVFDAKYSTPQALFIADTIDFFSCVVQNTGNTNLTDVELTIALLNEDLDILTAGVHTFDLPANDFAIITQDDIDIAFIWDLPVAQGTYYILYSVSNDVIEEEDEDLDNNIHIVEFVVNDNSSYVSSRWDGFVAAPAATASLPVDFPNIPYASGTHFEFWDVEETFILNSITFGVAGVARLSTGGNQQNPALLDGAPIDVFVFRVLNLGATLNGAGTYEDQELVGFGDYIASSADHFQEVTVEVFNLDGDELTLTNNNRYLPMVELPNGQIWLGYDFDNFTRWANFSSPTGGTVYFYPVSHFWSGAFQGVINTGILSMSLNFNIHTSVADKQELPEAAVTMFPNPASDNTMLNFSFENPTNVSVSVADMNGRLISFNRLENVMNDTHTINTSSLAAGNYIVKVSTPDAAAVRKLVVIK